MLRIRHPPAEQIDRVESSRGLKFAPHLVVHRSEAGRVRSPFQRLEIQFGQIHTVPIEALNQTRRTRANSFERLSVPQVDQLAPVELRVLRSEERRVGKESRARWS